jgi:hypothetical protein
MYRSDRTVGGVLVLASRTARPQSFKSDISKVERNLFVAKGRLPEEADTNEPVTAFVTLADRTVEHETNGAKERLDE